MKSEVPTLLNINIASLWDMRHFSLRLVTDVSEEPNSSISYHEDRILNGRNITNIRVISRLSHGRGRGPKRLPKYGAADETKFHG
jgi:hypothetical protein